MSEQQITVIKDLIARARTEPVPVIALTDEEVAALDGEIAELGPVPMPWLAGLDEASRKLACQVALRGLAARRLAVPLDPGGAQTDGTGTGGDVPQRVALRDDLRAVLLMRRSAHGAVFALRQSDGRIRLVYLGKSGALEEAISPGGVHGFTVLGLGAVAGRLAAFADPDDAAAATPAFGPPSVLRLADIAQGADLPGVAGARTVTMVTRLVFGSAAGEQRLTVYATEAGLTVASPADADGEPGLRFAQVSRSGLRDRMSDLLDLSAPALAEQN